MSGAEPTHTSRCRGNQRLIFLEALTHILSVIHLFSHSFLLLALSLHNTLPPSRSLLSGGFCERFSQLPSNKTAPLLHAYANVPDLKLGFKEMNKERSSVFGHRHGGPDPADKNTEAAGVILQRSKDLQTAPGGRVDLAVAHGPKAALLHTRLLGHFILCSPVWLGFPYTSLQGVSGYRWPTGQETGGTHCSIQRNLNTRAHAHTQLLKKKCSVNVCQSIADEEILISATSKTTTLTNLQNL